MPMSPRSERARKADRAAELKRIAAAIEAFLLQNPRAYPARDLVRYLGLGPIETSHTIKVAIRYHAPNVRSVFPGNGDTHLRLYAHATYAHALRAAFYQEARTA